MGVEGLTDEPRSEPGEEEGNDQEASTGVEVPSVTEDDLEDAPVDPADDDDDSLEPDGPHTPAPPEAPPEEDGA